MKSWVFQLEAGALASRGHWGLAGMKAAVDGRGDSDARGGGGVGRESEGSILRLQVQQEEQLGRECWLGQVC